MNYHKYLCITCGNMIEVKNSNGKPLFCPVCKNVIFQEAINETNQFYKFLVPWDLSIYNQNEKDNLKIHKKIADFHSGNFGDETFF